MAAVIELTVYCKKIIGLDQVIKEFKKMNYEVEMKTAEIMDDWEYNNYQELTYCFNWSDIVKKISDNRIFISRLKLNSVFDVGYNVCATKDDYFEISLWLNTDKLKHFDEDKITESNKAFYDILTSKIINVLKDNILKLAGIGVETSIEYDNDTLNIIRNSKNIIRWILPDCCSLQSEEFNFSKEKIGDFYIFSLN